MALVGAYLQFATGSERRAGPAPIYGFEVVNVYPHDPQAYTQGLLYRDGYLFESTGLEGRSTLRKVELETGRIVQRLPIGDQYFAEGLADYDDRLLQLTWRSRLGFVYDLETFRRLRTFPYEGEGWGLTRDGERLVMSDGTPRLRFLDPTSLDVIGTLDVYDNGRPVPDLNELEMVRGELFANVWQTDHIVMISLDTGTVSGRIDLRGLLPGDDRRLPVDVLNGIAYDADGDRLFVTGKLWPRLFEIRVTGVSR